MERPSIGQRNAHAQLSDSVALSLNLHALSQVQGGWEGGFCNHQLGISRNCPAGLEYKETGA